MTENIICALISALASIIVGVVTLIGVKYTVDRGVETLNKTFAINFKQMRTDFNIIYRNWKKYDLLSFDEEMRIRVIKQINDSEFTSFLEEFMSKEYRLTLINVLHNDYKEFRTLCYRISHGVNAICSINEHEYHKALINKESDDSIYYFHFLFRDICNNVCIDTGKKEDWNTIITTLTEYMDSLYKLFNETKI